MNTTAHALAAADLNRDGLGDLLAATCYSGNWLTVYLNRGAGNLTRSYRYRLDKCPDEIETQDVNRDGTPDIALVTFDNASTYPTNKLALFQNDGTGRLTEGWEYAAPHGLQGVNFGNVTAQNNADLVLINGERIEIFRNDGAGNYSFAGFATPEENRVWAYDIADVDGDGFSDLIVSALGNAVYGGIFINDGSGQFSFRGTQIGQRTCRFQDIDQDGYNDAICRSRYGGYVDVLRNNGRGAFELRRSLALGGEDIWNARTYGGMFFADFNGDGSADFFNFQNAFEGSGTVLFADSNGLTEVPPLTIGHSAKFVLADLHRDGNVDILSADYGHVTISMGDGQGSYLPFVRLNSPWTNSGQSSPIVADFDGDGFKDFIVAGGRHILLYRGDGSGSFRAEDVSGQNIYAVSVKTVDFDGDECLDVATSDGSGGFRILRNDCRGHFTASPDQYMMQLSDFYSDDPNSFLVKDTNGDGLSDLIVAGKNRVLVFRNLGNGNFNQEHLAAYDGKFARSMLDVDVNGDGIKDIAMISVNTTDPLIGEVDKVVTFLGDAAGHYVPSQELVLRSPAHTVAIGDIDANGGVDIVAAGRLGLNVFINGTFAGPAFIQKSSASLIIDDFNGDGVADIILGRSEGVVPILGPFTAR